MADISTAVSMARVPILGENGRISDDYIPAAIGEGVESAEAAATRAESAATDAEGSASAADQSATQAAGSASAASASASRAQQSATTAGSAATFAQSAQTAAEEAKTAAEAAQSAAAGSAQDAQQSATAAHQSAASVADKFIASAQATTLEPGSQATASVENQVLTIGVPKGDKGDQGEKGDTGTGVPEGGEPGQLLSKTDSGTAWVDPPSGNVLKGTLGPAPILSADDAYATKPRRLTVYGETRQNLWVNASTSSAGITLTKNENGSITVSGTASGTDSLGQPNNYTMRPNTTYTVSINNGGAGQNGFLIREYDVDGTTLASHYFGGTKASNDDLSVTFRTSASLDHFSCLLSFNAGETLSGTYRVMLNEGSTAQPWCPPGLHSVEPKELVTAGKNLLDFSKFNPTYYDVSGDGLKIVTTDDQAWSNIQPMLQLPPGDYTFICEGAERQQIGTRNVGGTDWNIRASSPIHMSTPFEIVFKVFADVDTVVYPQLEFGSTATEYEPPNITTAPIDLDGHSLCSLPDGTRDELTIDATGAVTLTQRVGVVEYGAGDLSSNTTAFANVSVSGAYAGGVDFSAMRQLSDFAPIGNSDVVLGFPQTGVYTLPSESKLRVGTGKKSASPAAQLSELKSMLGSATWHHLYALATPETIPLPAVTLPTLPAPTVNVYADAESSGTGYAMAPDAEMEYERDVTIAFDKLQAQVSATTVREATNG